MSFYKIYLIQPFSIFLVCLWGSLGLAAHHKLFQSQSVKVEGYQRIIETLEIGDTLELSNGKTFTVSAKPRHGSLTWVIDVGTGWMLRIPYTYEGDGGEARHRAGIDNFVSEYEVLAKGGVAVVDVDRGSAIQGEAVLVRKINIQFTLQDLVSGNTEAPKDSGLLLDKLVEFMVTTAKFKRIGDFSPSQIAWDGKRWILFDWNNQSELVSQPEDRTSAVDGMPFGEAFKNRIEAAIQAARGGIFRGMCRSLF